MNKKSLSKFLSLILRHKPEELGISLNKFGWGSTHEIIEKMRDRGMNVDLELIKDIVAQSDKQRFKLSNDSSLIRANQGHSIKVDLELKPTTPPDKLFHGTALRNRDSILNQGIKKRNRHQVHLSKDKITAQNVGQRHGKPIIITIDSRQMCQDGLNFYLSDNGVWLVDFVDPKYLKIEN